MFNSDSTVELAHYTNRNLLFDLPLGYKIHCKIKSFASSSMKNSINCSSNVMII